MDRKTIGRRYPFVFFMSIGIAPMSLWIWTIEAALNFNFYESDTTMDTVFSFSFGQVHIYLPENDSCGKQSN